MGADEEVGNGARRSGPGGLRPSGAPCSAAASRRHARRRALRRARSGSPPPRGHRTARHRSRGRRRPRRRRHRRRRPARAPAPGARSLRPPSARTSPPSRSISTDESTAIIAQGSTGSPGARPRSSRMTSSVLTPGGSLKRPRRRDSASSTFLRRMIEPPLELDLQLGALGQPEGIAHGLGQGDLAAFGNGRFHGALLQLVCMNYTYFSRHIQVAPNGALPVSSAGCRSNSSM